MSYKIINPIITGTLDNNFTGSTPLDAAHQAYTSISEHFLNTLDKFIFTIQSGGDKYHFTVKETVGKDNNVSFKISPYTDKINEDKFKKAKRSFERKMEGGKRKHHKHDDDSSSSDSDSPYFRKINLPISSWWYYPYYYNYYNTDLVYYPSFAGQVPLISAL